MFASRVTSWISTEVARSAMFCATTVSTLTSMDVLLAETQHNFNLIVLANALSVSSSTVQELVLLSLVTILAQLARAL